LPSTPISIDRSIIAAHSDTRDGKAAWDTFVERFGQPDTGTTVELVAEYTSLRWTGGDTESFMEFLGRFETKARELRRKGVDFEDWVHDILLVGMVPVDLFLSAADLNIKEPKKISLPSIISQSAISLRERDVHSAYYAKPIGRGDVEKQRFKTARPSEGKDAATKSSTTMPSRDYCSICKDKLQLPEEKCRHPESDRFNRGHFAKFVGAAVGRRVKPTWQLSTGSSTLERRLNHQRAHPVRRYAR
jgi:hypothetical protein